MIMICLTFKSYLILLDVRVFLSSIVKDPLNGAMYIVEDVSGQKWGDIVALVRFGCMVNKSIVKDLIIKSIRLWVEICDFSYDDTDPSTSDPIYDTFLFKSYMSVAGDNPDLNKFIVSLRGRMLKYDLRSLYLYLAIFMAINGGILLARTIFLPLLSYDCICDVDQISIFVKNDTR